MRTIILALVLTAIGIGEATAGPCNVPSDRAKWVAMRGSGGVRKAGRKLLDGLSRVVGLASRAIIRGSWFCLVGASSSGSILMAVGAAEIGRIRVLARFDDAAADGAGAGELLV